ncbi:hypothetical protein KTN05_15290 [Paracoccus sp. Z118]|uniref:hypothetical protein n=1 Tax=Paracoccus sp. Z118 TaxID=2851017 RepID=UPI001C2BC375|nr:hypothetical protein [Paracoccus sp. Z118]MBV0893178.1 hypothetical protein [Paracoccus sp. Z118]
MARLTGSPAVWHPLPDDLAAELGRTIASFGHLEDMLKRAIFALERDRLSGEILEPEFRAWLRRMRDVAVDSLGNLIERFDTALRRANRAEAALIAQLNSVKDWRNILCHAAWQPAPAGGWAPVFASTRGQAFEGTIDPAQLRTICELSLDAALRVARLIDDLLVADWTTTD